MFGVTKAVGRHGSGPRVMARTKDRITISAVTFFAWVRGGEVANDNMYV
jgi:hypothetical protein